eukprot:scaffold233066_cov74-Cyclotella_meneghiniana.AAC.5
MALVTSTNEEGNKMCSVLGLKAPMTSEKSYEILKALWLFGYSNAGFLISDGNLLRSNRKPIPTGNCNAKCDHDGILAIQVTYFVWARVLRAHNHVR